MNNEDKFSLDSPKSPPGIIKDSKHCKMDLKLDLTFEEVAETVNNPVKLEE
jgi:hypothetical protein